jgi:hypothetical protein
MPTRLSDGAQREVTGVFPPQPHQPKRFAGSAQDWRAWLSQHLVANPPDPLAQIRWRRAVSAGP